MQYRNNGQDSLNESVSCVQPSWAGMKQPADMAVPNDFSLIEATLWGFSLNVLLISHFCQLFAIVVADDQNFAHFHCTTPSLLALAGSYSCNPNKNKSPNPITCEPLASFPITKKKTSLIRDPVHDTLKEQRTVSNGQRAARCSSWSSRT